MAKYIDAEKIRAEIERRKKENMYYELPMTIGRYYEDRDLLSFLDTLEELDIKLINRSWYMEGYHDREFNKEPKWIIKTGEGGPRYEENPKYGQHIEEKPAEWSEDFDKEVENVHKRYPEVSYAKLTRIAYHFSKWANRYKGIKWSEEDKQILHSFEVICQRLIENPHGEKFEVERSYAKKMLSWLKSLRPSWKPSEEQMEALNALNCHGDLSYVGQQNQLISLYDDLKKLM